MIDYNAHNWRSHLLDIKGSMVRQIISRVLSCTVWSAIVVYIHEKQFPLAFSERAHVLIGVALGLLLVFRTNASYDRFWEGRKLWGSIINECRNLGRAGSVYLAGVPDLQHKLIGWTAAFPYAAMNHLRGNRGIGSAKDLLAAEEVNTVLAAENVPLAVARQITTQLAVARQRGASPTTR